MLCRKVPKFLIIMIIFTGSLSVLSASVPEQPFFSFRGWETQVDGLWCGSRGGSNHWYKNPFYLSYLDLVLQEAPKYDANALILMGRHNYAEIHTFVSYQKWPRLHQIYQNRGRKDRELQIQTLNELIVKAAKYGVEIYLWDHEIHIPSELSTLYPSIAGKGARFCPCAPELWQFIHDKYEEFLERVPGIGGVFLVLSETQSVLLDGSPCKCDQCRKSSPEDHLENLIRAVYRPLKKRNKRLIVRTFGHSLNQIRTISNSINRLPKDLDLTVMSKATPCDFFGFHYPDNPAIAAVENRPQFLEETFGEFRGKTNIICIPSRFYRQRIQNAAKHGLEGIVVRLEHNGYPKHNFEMPNLFNIYYVSKLWQDPNINPRLIWQEWFAKRYGKEAARYLIPAFRNTEQIWEQSTNTLGFYTTSAHGNLAPMYHGPYNAWDNLNHSVDYVTKGFPKWDDLGKKLINPNDEMLRRITEEISEVNQLADTTRELVQQALPHLSSQDRKELNHYFNLTRETTRLFSHLKMLFFLGLQADQSTGQRRAKKIEHAFRVSSEAIKQARTLEREFGRNHWPLSPDDGRGSSFYSILIDYWTHCLMHLEQGKSLPKSGWSKSLNAASSAARLYQELLNAARTDGEKLKSLEFTLDRGFRQVRFEDRKIVLVADTNREIHWPLAIAVQGPSLRAGPDYSLEIKFKEERLSITAELKPDLNKSLHEYQRRQLQRDQELREKIQSREELASYKSKVRKRFREILGRPERTPLSPVVTGILVRDGYRIEKILIQSRPDFYVPINLYVPTDRSAPMPAVLRPLGHAPDGKAFGNYQATFINLAQKGYVVCAYDPLGQGEREPYMAKTGNHHYIQGYQCMPSRYHLAQYFIWDGIRCLDYLETRPEVDRNRIACAGCSGGGALTNYLAALDDRIALAVPASWIAESTWLTRDGGLHPESWFPDMCSPYGPGTRQLLACIAPRPLLILGNDNDPEFPPAGMQAVYQDTKNLYESLGFADRVEYISVPTKHGFWPPARRELYRFLNHWFDKKSESADETTIKLEKKADLYCAPNGQVRNLPNAQTVWSLNQKAMMELQEQRIKKRNTLSFPKYQAFIREGVQKATLYRPCSETIRTHSLNASSLDGGSCKRIILEYDPDFSVLADLYIPGKESEPYTDVVLVSDDNKKAGEIARKLLGNQIRILHFHGRKSHVRQEIMAGKPRAGRWAALFIRGAKYLHSKTTRPSRPVVAVGLGKVAAPAARFAAILEPDQITGVVTIGGLDSIESLSEKPDESNSLQVSIPGACRWFDESDLLAGLAPKPVLVADVRDKQGNVIPEEKFLRVNTWPFETYKAKNHEGQLQFSAGPLEVERLVNWLKATATSQNAAVEK